MYITDWQELSRKPEPAPGVAEEVTSLVSMSNGARYIKRDVLALDSRYDSKIGLLTALGTRVTGFNTQNAEQIAACGSDVSIVGFNQAHNAPTSLSEDAAAAAQILAAERHNDGSVRAIPRPHILFGKSRGGMKAFGVSAYAPIYDLEVPVSIHEDPCLAQKTSLTETKEGLTPEDFFEELAEFGQYATQRLSGESRLQQLGRLAAMARTISPHPHYLRAQIHSGKALWTGEAGLFTPYISEDQIIACYFFNRNKLNHRDKYVQLLGHLPLARIVDEDVKHMALARPEVVTAGVDNIEYTQRLLQRGASKEEIADFLAHPLTTVREHKHGRTRHLRLVG
jgi:hypothetical protein